MSIPTNNQIICSICHRAIPIKAMVITEIEEYHVILCPECSGYIGNCSSCDYGRVCNFKNDHSEPQIINKRIQQGFATIMTQGKNPHLIEKHCKTCRCSYDIGEADPVCQRDIDNGNNCGRYKIMPELLKLGIKIK